jgi:hypothetical protein
MKPGLSSWKVGVTGNRNYRRKESMNENLKTELLENAQKQPICQHCNINPEATKPYMKRVDVPMDELTDKVLEKVSAETGVSKVCVLCVSFLQFMKLSREDQLELLKNEMEWRKKHGYA